MLRKVLRKPILWAFAALLACGWILQIHPPQVNVSWKLPFGAAVMADNLAGNGSYFQVNGTTDCLSSGQIGWCTPTLTYSGQATFSGTNPAITLSGAPPQITGTNTSGLEIDATSTTTGDVFDQKGGITGATANFTFKGGGSDVVLITFTGNGNLNVPAGSILDTGGNIKAVSVSAGNGQILAGNATADAIVTGGAFIVGSGGMYQQGTNCAQTVAHSAGTTSTVTLTQWMCKLTTSGTAGDLTFTLTFPGSVALTNAPMCIVTDLAAIVSEPTCTTTTTQASIVYGTAPATGTAFAYVWLVGNGP